MNLERLKKRLKNIISISIFCALAISSCNMNARKTTDIKEEFSMQMELYNSMGNNSKKMLKNMETADASLDMLYMEILQH